MSLEIKVVTNDKKGMKLFKKFQWDMYKNDPFWAPDLIMNLDERLNPKHPFFEFGSAEFFLAYRDGNIVGRISVVEFDNIQSLTPEGNGLYSSKDTGRAATETVVKQGYLEGSNVNPVQEMTRMIEILRTYQSTMRMINNEHDRQVNAIKKIGEKAS